MDHTLNQSPGALHTAASDNNVTEVWIAKGMYRPTEKMVSDDDRSATFQLLSGVSLFGGFAGSEQSLEERDRNADGSWVHETILSGDLGENDDQSTYVDNAYTVVFASELNEPVTLDGLTITAGRSDNTGGLEAEMTDGGGIYLASGTLTVTNSTLTGNAADGYGGGIASVGTLTVTNSTLTGNQAGSDGGGIFVDSGTVNVANSTFESNSAESGGGIFVDSGTVSVANSTFESNSAESGGGIFVDSGTVSVANSTFEGNDAANGGGISSDGTLTVTNSTLTGNQANRGGGIANYGGLKVVNATIVENTAQDDGGGVHTFNSTSVTTLLHNTIVAGNVRGTDDSPDDISGKDVAEASSHNLIGAGGSGGLKDGSDGNIVGVADLAWLMPLGDYGGPTPTHAIALGSPAIDAGSDAVAANPDGDENTEDQLTTDQRGAPFARVFGEHVDIGAYEVQSLDLVVDTAEDESDGDFSEGDLALREAIALANANPGLDTIWFHDVLKGTNITLAWGELRITDDLTITGLGAEQLAISGNGESRIFAVNDDDVATAITVEISGLTLKDGLYSWDGGAICNYEELALVQCTLADNFAALGGAIINYGTLSVVNSTIADNSTSAYSGGAIYNKPGATLSVINSTIAKNSAGALGGGIFNYGSLLVSNSTIAQNTANSHNQYPNPATNGGGIATYDFADVAATTTLHNTIVAGNVRGTDGSPDDISGKDVEQASSHNLIGDADSSGGLVAMADDGNGNIVGVTDLSWLAPLGDYGGPTQTPRSACARQSGH